MLKIRSPFPGLPGLWFRENGARDIGNLGVHACMLLQMAASTAKCLQNGRPCVTTKTAGSPIRKRTVPRSLSLIFSACRDLNSLPGIFSCLQPDPRFWDSSDFFWFMNAAHLDRIRNDSKNATASGCAISEWTSFCH